MSSKRREKRKLLITAGPTREPIDPVRYLSNHSTGMLGHLLAKEAKARGHQVTLVSGPTQIAAPAGVKTIAIESAADLQQAVARLFPKMDALIMSAAVADFRPIRVAKRKIKRSGAVGSLRLWKLELIENPDIVAETAHQRKPNQLVVGFALETEKLLPNAKLKLKSKGLDAIVATELKLTGQGKNKGPFGRDPVSGAIIEAGGKTKLFKALSKTRLSARILDTVEGLLAKRLSDAKA